MLTWRASLSHLHAHTENLGTLLITRRLVWYYHSAHPLVSTGECTTVITSVRHLIHKDDVELWNRAMVWVRRDLKDYLIPTPLPWKGTPSTRPGCSKLRGLKHFQGWGIHSFSGQPVPVPHYSQSKFLPYT